MSDDDSSMGSVFSDDGSSDFMPDEAPVRIISSTLRNGFC
jgi:hypothetical protein